MSKPFVKVIPPGSWNFDEPMTRLVNVHSRGVDSDWMLKTAAAGVFKDADIKPEKDHSFIHVIALGDSDYYGGNRNGDIFYKQACDVEIPEPCEGVSKHVHINCGNVDRHHTFEKFAKVYRNHRNKNPKKSHGDVVKSAHNEKLSRVELMIKVPDATWGAELEKLASGGTIEFSMACKVPFDICSFCGHKSASKEAYCSHLKDHMTEITKSGHSIGAINDYMTYFDISRVRVNADRIAFGLMKAASLDGERDGFLSGADLAEHFTLFPPGERGQSFESKVAMLLKLAEIEKEIEGKACAGSKELRDLARALSPGSLHDDDMRGLKVARAKIPDLLGGLADAKISLSLRDFLKLVMGDKFDDAAGHADEAEGLLPGIFSRLSGDPGNFDDFDLGGGPLPASVRQAIERFIPSKGLDDGSVKKRMTIMIIRGSKPPEIKADKAMNKESGASPVAEKMAEAYAKYKVAFCERVSRADDTTALTTLAVLPHYISAEV